MEALVPAAYRLLREAPNWAAWTLPLTPAVRYQVLGVLLGCVVASCAVGTLCGTGGRHHERDGASGGSAQPLVAYIRRMGQGAHTALCVAACMACVQVGAVVRACTRVLLPSAQRHNALDVLPPLLMHLLLSGMAQVSVAYQAWGAGYWYCVAFTAWMSGSEFGL